MDVRRAAFRLTEIFDYRTFAVAGAFATLCIVGFLVVSSAQTAHDALEAQQSSGQRAARRIDGLQRVIAEQAQRISDNSSEQTRLREQIDSLTHQVEQMGGRPVVEPEPSPRRTYVVSSPPARPRATPSPSRSPRPFVSPSPSRTPRPSSSPSPTCRPLPIIGCPGHAR